MILQRNTGYKQVGVHLKATTGKITHLGLGRSLRFLVAADITAFAAGAEGGEHMERVERALLFACLGFLMTVSLGAFQVLARIHSKRSLLLFDGSRVALAGKALPGNTWMMLQLRSRMHIEGTLGCKVSVLLVDGVVCTLFSVAYIVLCVYSNR